MYCVQWIVKLLFFGFFIWLSVENVDSVKAFLDYSTNMLHKLPIFGSFIDSNYMKADGEVWILYFNEYMDETFMSLEDLFTCFIMVSWGYNSNPTLVFRTFIC